MSKISNGGVEKWRLNGRGVGLNGRGVGFCLSE